MVNPEDGKTETPEEILADGSANDKSVTPNEELETVNSSGNKTI